MKSHHDIFRDALAALRPVSDDHVIEIGCGGGTFASWMLRSGCRVTAVDHSADMVALTRRNNAEAVAAGRLAVATASAGELPFPAGKFSAAVMTNVFFFLDAAPVVAELVRVLAPGGRVVVHTLAADRPAAVVPRPVVRRMRLYSDDELAGLFETAGFTSVSVGRVGGGSFQLVTAIRGDIEH
ncbi:class I SAM-dependent methyltransferase [Nocardia speluncae]|nr:class I SAM-dependent methyltransferase [Nocardia speluncae]